MEREFEVGKVYFSKKLQQPFFCLPRHSGVVSSTEYVWRDSAGTLWIDEYVDLNSLEGPMVRLCHYEAVMQTAERLVALGLDKLEQDEV